MAFASLDGVAITADNAAVSTDGIHMPRASVALLATLRYAVDYGGYMKELDVA